jgi:muramoyltetrapeptide carboxypeptidase
MIAKKIKFGDTIGIIAPSSIENEESIKRGIDFFQKLGFKIKEGKHIYDKAGYLAGKDEDRAEDFMNMFLDKEVHMILCIRGGYGAMRILPYLDFKLIKSNPKIFMGFSDITVLLNTLKAKSQLITFHSPMLTSNYEDKCTLNSFFNAIMEGDKPYIIKNPDDIPVDCRIKGEVSGELVGGNLCLICSTLGTPYEIDTKDKILFIEDIGEEPYKIDRMLTQLNLAGKLKSCKGFIIGQFNNCTPSNPERSFTLENLIEEKILQFNKPTLINFMSGHLYPKLTLPIGAKIKLDGYNGIIEVMEPVVKGL